MDWRVKTFKEKFESAQETLKGKSIQDVVSLKFREGCINSHEYNDYFQYLRHDLMLDIIPASGKFQGNAFTITDRNKNKILAVEHETGLEILYIAGSIASLIQLLPTVINAWNYLRNGFPARLHNFSNGRRNGIEIRNFNSKKVLVEQNISSAENYIFNMNYNANQKILEDNIRLKNEIKKLRKIIKSLKKDRKNKK